LGRIILTRAVWHRFFPTPISPSTTLQSSSAIIANTSSSSSSASVSFNRREDRDVPNGLFLIPTMGDADGLVLADPHPDELREEEARDDQSSVQSSTHSESARSESSALRSTTSRSAWR